MSGPSARNPWRHPLVALILPALLLALGIWQLTRVEGASTVFEARADRLQDSVGRLQQLAARRPDAPIQFNGDTQTYTATTALARLQEAQAELKQDALVDEARTAAAWLTTGAAALALVAVVTALAAATAGARHGRASRPALVSAFQSVVRILPTLLGAVAVATALSITGAVLFEIGGAWFLQSIDTGEVKLIIAGLCLAFAAIAFAVSSVRQLGRALAAFTPQPMLVLGRAASPAEAPALWAFLRDIAGRQGAAVPDNIVLGLTQGFFVTQSKVRLAPEERVLAGQTLYLPMTLLPMLSRGETEAVVAHELAHFTGEDTQFSQHFLPLFASMSRTMAAVTSRQRTRHGREALWQPASVLAGHVLDSFGTTVSHWSRLREFEADQAALHAGRARDAATALIRTGIGSGLTQGALDDMFEHPARASRDVVGAVLERAAAIGFQSPARHLEDRQPHPTDTHPPTRQRIEALGIPIDDTLLAEASRPVQDTDATFATSLFADWDGLHQQLGADLLAVAHTREQQRMASLRQAAAAVTQDTPVYERTLRNILVCGIVAALLAVPGVFLLWIGLATNSVEPDTDTLILPGTGAALLAMAAVMAWFAYDRHRRGKAGPFLVVGPAGFCCLGLAGPVPWSDVAGVQVSVGRAFITTFHLTEGAILPAQTGWRWSVRRNQAKRRLTLRGFIPRGMKPQAYLDLINAALRAHRARRVLTASSCASTPSPSPSSGRRPG